MSDMSTSKKRIIQSLYFASQFLSIGSAFSGSMLGIYDYTHPSQRFVPGKEYIWIFGLGFLAASIGSFTAHKFQGQKIGAKEEDHDVPAAFPADLAPQNWKSRVAEGSYLGFSFALSIANNYLLIAGLNAFFQNSSQPILPPGPIGITLFIVKTMFFDMIFDGTSAIYEACEEIKESLTHTKEGTLLSLLLRPLTQQPFALKALTLWIQIAGVFNHTGTDIISFILSVPSLLSIIPGIKPVDTINDFITTPGLMYPILIVSSVLFVLNCIQTLYFEATESRHNLSKLSEQGSEYSAHPLLYTAEPEKSIIRKLLLWKPILKDPIGWGFYTQGPVHAFGDLMPVVLLLRDIFDRYDAAGSIPGILTITILSAIVFVGSCWGTHHSEVTTAHHHFQEEFSSIENERRHYDLAN